MSCPQTDEQVNMILCPTDRFRNTVRGANQTAEVFMQSRTPCFGDKGMPIFRAEHDVEMQAEMS